ncbi:MAG: hypothetical protein II167_05340 [Clostridiales bacterium]|nr:hypothetical protein [Clostridiales bacterium]
MTCPRCGTVMSGGVCPECGFPVTVRRVATGVTCEVVRRGRIIRVGKAPRAKRK